MLGSFENRSAYKKIIGLVARNWYHSLYWFKHVFGKRAAYHR